MPDQPTPSSSTTHLEPLSLRLTTRLQLINRVRPRVTFTPDTVNNEHHGLRSSKLCCIFKIGKDKSKNKYERC
ncbi:putative phosphatase inhibitor protein [Pseudoloma neurophilia]|uniref:Putative phosphatase inhibitor protein n=1 Tax=Pseudoloma neurophilia TaxID=146866 RepID=A0A0R0LSX3_9MICR|nr:putative phosphatase inhibitor protein [Pseudoloma neurophilia]